MYYIIVILIMSNDTLEKQYRELFLKKSPNKQNERIEFMKRHNLNELVKLKLNDDSYGIHTASADGHCEVVKRFLDLGVNVNIKSFFGGTPLHIASYYEYKDIVKLLIKAGANPNARNRYSGGTPLHHASNYGHKYIVKLLIKAGANPNIADNYGNTPLHDASCNGHKDIVKLLLKVGANPNVINEYGNTPLHLALIKVYKEIVKLLLKVGANPNVSNNNGITPLCFASSNKEHNDTIKILLKAGANPNVSNSVGVTSLRVASYYGHKDIIKTLINVIMYN